MSSGGSENSTIRHLEAYLLRHNRAMKHDKNNVKYSAWLCVCVCVCVCVCACVCVHVCVCSTCHNTSHLCWSIGVMLEDITIVDLGICSPVETVAFLAPLYRSMMSELKPFLVSGSS